MCYTLAHCYHICYYQDGCDDKRLVCHCMQGPTLVSFLLNPENLYQKQILLIVLSLKAKFSTLRKSFISQTDDLHSLVIKEMAEKRKQNLIFDNIGRCDISKSKSM